MQQVRGRAQDGPWQGRRLVHRLQWHAGPSTHQPDGLNARLGIGAQAVQGRVHRTIGQGGRAGDDDGRGIGAHGPAASSLPTCAAVACSPGAAALHGTGAIVSSISRADTPAASRSLTVRMTLTAFPNPSSPSTIKLTSAMRVMRRHWSTASDRLYRTIVTVADHAAAQPDARVMGTMHRSITVTRTPHTGREPTWHIGHTTNLLGQVRATLSPAAMSR